jgi:hypothetical protein
VGGMVPVVIKKCSDGEKKLEEKEMAAEEQRW